jgi:hypothetical protein
LNVQQTFFPDSDESGYITAKVLPVTSPSGIDYIPCHRKCTVVPCANLYQS